METHLKVIRQLADGELHSGSELAERLGISRAAVWKAVRKAGEVLGLMVRSVRARGYRLSAPLELLDRERILGEISHETQQRIVAGTTEDKAGDGSRPEQPGSRPAGDLKDGASSGSRPAHGTRVPGPWHEKGRGQLPVRSGSRPATYLLAAWGRGRWPIVSDAAEEGHGQGRIR